MPLIQWHSLNLAAQAEVVTATVTVEAGASLSVQGVRVVQASVTAQAGATLSVTPTVVHSASVSAEAGGADCVVATYVVGPSVTMQAGIAAIVFPEIVHSASVTASGSATASIAAPAIAHVGAVSTEAGGTSSASGVIVHPAGVTSEAGGAVASITAVTVKRDALHAEAGGTLNVGQPLVTHTASIEARAGATVSAHSAGEPTLHVGAVTASTSSTLSVAPLVIHTAAVMASAGATLTVHARVIAPPVEPPVVQPGVGGGYGYPSIYTPRPKIVRGRVDARITSRLSVFARQVRTGRVTSEAGATVTLGTVTVVHSPHITISSFTFFAADPNVIRPKRRVVHAAPKAAPRPRSPAVEAPAPPIVVRASVSARAGATLSVKAVVIAPIVRIVPPKSAPAALPLFEDAPHVAPISIAFGPRGLVLGIRRKERAA
jgi:hypothetical protein